MYGFENITANNGWAMAVVGATTVFTGLVVLSFVISQVHKILRFWENRDELLDRGSKPAETVATKPETPKPVVSAARYLPNVKELTSIYRPLVEQLNQPFELSQLFEISNKMELPHPHLSIRSLQEAGLLVTQGDGTFIWDKQKEN